MFYAYCLLFCTKFTYTSNLNADDIKREHQARMMVIIVDCACDNSKNINADVYYCDVCMRACLRMYIKASHKEKTLSLCEDIVNEHTNWPNGHTCIRALCSSDYYRLLYFSRLSAGS